MKHFIFLFLFLFGLHASAKDVTCTEKLGVAPISIGNKSDLLRMGILSTIHTSLRKLALAGVNVDSLSLVLETPPKIEMGQAAFPVFQLAKVLRMAPSKIAQSLIADLKANLPPMIHSAEVAGGYINFHLDFEAYADQLAETIASGRFFSPENLEKEKISLEFSQPNTHKALHVGHMRNMFLGEAVAKLFEYFGHTVVRSTYPGDLGTHVAKALWYIRTFKAAEIPQTPSADWLGRMYAEADQYVKANEAAAKPGIADMLRNIDSAEGSDYELYLKTREWSLAEMRDVYAWLGIRFDQWYCESECDLPSRRLVEQKFNEGVLQKDDGAIGLDLKNEGLGFVLMLKQDGTGLYLTKDLELMRRKFDDAEVTRSIVVVDARQQLHFKQLFRAAELMGFAKAKSSVHLSYETVTDAQGNALSSRTLNGLTVTALREKFAAPVSLANLRYGFLRVAPSDQIRFDLEQWLRADDDSAANLLAMLDVMTTIANPAARSAGPMSAREQEILLHLSRFNPTIAKAAQNYDPSEVARYLGQLNTLLKTWNRDGSANAGLIANASAQILQKGLELLGINPVATKL